ncbi:hypothetical protein F5J12DRAFT_889422 [Pisolithus orientalis]|uniref:uncharacterized protein n=1 Tax=Pisolithus orientalis TaxID=936130 RepID=UPI002224E309|nr:uncharacterized protein F5J12DRAFT_889422 [Pisolithus orientalis]KAI6028917.1 hypothetical protein F5J12DRAFT_889422 [Pisolithus orientalis]
MATSHIKKWFKLCSSDLHHAHQNNPSNLAPAATKAMAAEARDLVGDVANLVPP